MSNKKDFKFNIEFTEDNEIKILFSDSEFSTFQVSGKIPLLEDEERFYKEVKLSIQKSIFALISMDHITDYKINGNLNASK